MKKIALSILGIAILAACGSGPKTNQSAESCTLSINRFKTTVGWTAFKTTAKVGVKGKFDQVNITSQEANTVEDLLTGLEFIIKTNSVNTDNPQRDNTIHNYFFNTMETPGKINGGIQNAKDGVANVVITMNNISRETKLKYSLEGLEFTMNGVINLDDWNTQSSVKSLNDKCYDLHKGEDGISKLWSEVEINISSTLTQTCK